mmetsp:Transcript_92161/g.265942  ORF Transcript_92161/g.265942 Transcript_92161/m.265942 type:complete len:267 (-) Transcript_92161:982-1782(-)
MPRACIDDTRFRRPRRCLLRKSWSNFSSSKMCSRTPCFSTSTASRTPPTLQGLGNWSSAIIRSNSSVICFSARFATLRTSAFLPSTVCMMPNTLQSSGAVVALMMSVSAATLPTRKSTRFASRFVIMPPPRSSWTRIASAKPTKPRKPPHVITMTSRRETCASPARLSSGQSTAIVAKRMPTRKTHARSAQLKSSSSCSGMDTPVNMPARKNTKVLPIVSTTCQNSNIACFSTTAGHMRCESTSADATVLSTPDMWNRPSANKYDQ